MHPDVQTAVGVIAGKSGSVYSVSVGGNFPFLNVSSIYRNCQYFENQGVLLAFFNPDAPVIISPGYRANKMLPAKETAVGFMLFERGNWVRTGWIPGLGKNNAPKGVGLVVQDFGGEILFLQNGNFLFTSANLRNAGNREILKEVSFSPFHPGFGIGEEDALYYAYFPESYDEYLEDYTTKQYIHNFLENTTLEINETVADREFGNERTVDWQFLWDDEMELSVIDRTKTLGIAKRYVSCNGWIDDYEGKMIYDSSFQHYYRYGRKIWACGIDWEGKEKQYTEMTFPYPPYPLCITPKCGLLDENNIITLVSSRIYPDFEVRIKDNGIYNEDEKCSFNVYLADPTKADYNCEKWVEIAGNTDTIPAKSINIPGVDGEGTVKYYKSAPWEIIMGQGTHFTSDFEAGDYIDISGSIERVKRVYDDTRLEIERRFDWSSWYTYYKIRKVPKSFQQLCTGIAGNNYGMGSNFLIAGLSHFTDFSIGDILKLEGYDSDGNPLSTTALVQHINHSVNVSTGAPEIDLVTTDFHNWSTSAATTISVCDPYEFPGFDSDDQICSFDFHRGEFDGEDTSVTCAYNNRFDNYYGYDPMTFTVDDMPHYGNVNYLNIKKMSGWVTPYPEGGSKTVYGSFVGFTLDFSPGDIIYVYGRYSKVTSAWYELRYYPDWEAYGIEHYMTLEDDIWWTGSREYYKVLRGGKDFDEKRLGYLTINSEQKVIAVEPDWDLLSKPVWWYSEKGGNFERFIGKDLPVLSDLYNIDWWYWWLREDYYDNWDYPEYYYDAPILLRPFNGRPRFLISVTDYESRKVKSFIAIDKPDPDGFHEITSFDKPIAVDEQGVFDFDTWDTIYTNGRGKIHQAIEQASNKEYLYLLNGDRERDDVDYSSGQMKCRVFDWKYEEISSGLCTLPFTSSQLDFGYQYNSGSHYYDNFLVTDDGVLYFAYADGERHKVGVLGIDMHNASVYYHFEQDSEQYPLEANKLKLFGNKIGFNAGSAENPDWLLIQ